MFNWSKFAFPVSDARKIGAFAFNKLRPPTKDFKTVGKFAFNKLSKVKSPFEARRKTGEWAFNKLRTAATDYFRPSTIPKIGEVIGEGITSLAFGDVKKKGVKGIPEHIWEVEKSIMEIAPKFGFSAHQAFKPKGTLLTGKTEEKPYTVPSNKVTEELGFKKEYSTYQKEFVKTADNIIEGKEPLWHALIPFAEVPFDGMIVSSFLTSGAKSVFKKIKVNSAETAGSIKAMGLKDLSAKAQKTQFKKLSKEVVPRKSPELYSPTEYKRLTKLTQELNNANDILNKARTQGLLVKEPSKIALAMKNIAETGLGKPSEIGKAFAKKETPYLGVRGLLPEQAGTIPTKPFQARRQPAGLSIRDIEAKPIRQSDKYLETMRRGGESQKAFQMYSPNVGKSMSFTEASKKLVSSEQARFRSIAADINKNSGLTFSKTSNVIGDTKNYGVENATFDVATVSTPREIALSRIAIAQKGLVGNQLSTLNFIENIKGKDNLYIVSHNKNNVELRKILDDNGIEFRTLDEGKFLVYDEGKVIINKIKNVNKQINGKLETVAGKGEFIGGETRAEGLRAYKKIIEEGQVLSDSRLPKTKIKPAITEKVSEAGFVVPTKSVKELVSHEGAPDIKQVSKYVKLLKEGKKIDPIVVIKEGKKFGIEDGKHRFEAYKQLGYTEVPVKEMTPKLPTKKGVVKTPAKKVIVKAIKTETDEILEVKKFKTEKIAEKATRAKAKIREMGKPKGFELPKENTFRYLQRQLQDKMNRLELTQKTIIKVGGKVEEASDAYLKQELYYGKAGNVIDRFDNDFVMPFLKKAKNKKISIDDLGEFLYAKHAPERNIQIAKINKKLPTGGSGMTDEQAKTILAKFEKQGKAKDLDNLASEFYENVTKKRLKLLEESGLEKADTIKRLEEGYKNYIPLKGKEGVDRIGAVGQGFSITGKDVRRAFGRGSRAKNPFVQSILDYQSTLIRNEKNKVSKTFLKLVEDNPNPKIWEVKGLKYTPRYDKTGEMISLDPHFKFADNVLQVRVDGKIKLITIHDEVLANSMKNIGTERSIKLLYKTNSYLRSVNTIFNPEFLITNFQRDLQTALINVGGEQSLKMAKSTAKNIPKAMKGIWQNVRKGDTTSEWAKTYQELKDAGGKTGFFDMKTIDEKVRQLEKNIKIYNSDKTTDKMSGFVRSVGDYVSDVNEIVEMAVRTSAYKEAIKNGATKNQAASLAKNLTVNFNKKGNWGTMLNTFYLFANAGIQGSARVITALKYKNVRKIVGAISAGSFALNEMNRMINEEEYKKISDFNKNSNMIFMMPNGNHIKVKLPYGFNIFKIIGDIANESIHGEVDTIGAGKRLIVALDDAYNPLSSPTIAQFISPTILDPVVQWSENKNWFGSPIKPSQLTFGAKKRESSLYWGSVRPQTKAITEWLNKVTGGSEIEAGFVDISPENIDEIINFLGGGIGKFLSNSLATGISLSKGEMPKLKNIPFVRKVIQEPSDFWEKATIREIKEKSSIKELKEREISELKTAIRDGLKDEIIDKDEATKVVKEVLRNQAKIKAGRVYSKIKNASPEEKKEAISELNEMERKEFIKLLKKKIEEEL